MTVISQYKKLLLQLTHSILAGEATNFVKLKTESDMVDTVLKT